MHLEFDTAVLCYLLIAQSFVHYSFVLSQVLSEELAELDLKMTKQRGTLSGAKGVREKLRAETEMLKSKRGFSNNPYVT